MTPAELRSLADEATRAPFGWINLYGDGQHERVAQETLARLAPDLARLCAELGEALLATLGNIESDERVMRVCRCDARVALAKLAELETPTHHPPKGASCPA